MKPLLLTLSSFALILAGCSKHAPVAATPKAPDTTPVAEAPAPPPPAKPPAARPAPAPAPQQVAQAPRPQALPPEVRITLNDRLAKVVDAFFDFDKSTIRPDASTALKDDVAVIRDILAAYPSQKLLIEGHADERGTREYNIALGARRAQNVRDYLISRGVEGSRMRTISYGKERPVAVCNDISCWSQNRRAVTVLNASS